MKVREHTTIDVVADSVEAEPAPQHNQNRRIEMETYACLWAGAAIGLFVAMMLMLLAYLLSD